MTSYDKKMFVIGSLFFLAVSYYFLFPSRNWLGKQYLETTPQKDGFAVVELFTSEGCSSCPPADELMAEARAKAKGKNVYFLAFHVDYWDRQGWRDRFSAPEYTQRQEQYAARMGSSLIYTPQFIVNGTSEFPGNDARTLYSSISDALQELPESSLDLTATQGVGLLELRYRTGKPIKGTSLVVAVVQKDDSTSVKRGENGGHLLQHAQIVRDVRAVRLDSDRGTMEIVKPEGFSAQGWEIIGLIQNDSTGVIINAAKARIK